MADDTEFLAYVAGLPKEGEMDDGYVVVWENDDAFNVLHEIISSARQMIRTFPMPNDPHPDGTVVASTHYGDEDELHRATILVLRSESPYFRVGVWDYIGQAWDFHEDHYNIVPAVTGDRDPLTVTKDGYTQMGGDY